MRRLALVVLLSLVAAAAGPGAGSAAASARLDPSLDPRGRLVVELGGRALLRESAAARAGFRAGGRTYRAVRTRSAATSRATLATDDPAGRRIRVEVVRSGAQTGFEVTVVGGSTADVEAVTIGFDAPADERYLGFGERSDRVEGRGRIVESFVGEGPYPAADYPQVKPSIPPWGLRERRDATYFPLPWLISTRGYGVLVDGSRTSRFDLAATRRDAWSVEVEGARARVLLFGGGSPARLVRRFTARTGRQPPPVAPWQLGPWFQTGHANEVPVELDHVRDLRRADAPISAVETHMRYLPCGADRGREAAERARTRALHAAGLAALTYNREAVCADDPVAYREAVRRGVLTRRADGSPYAYEAFVGGRVTQVGQIDFTAPGADAFYASLLARSVANGYDGWMEDYGEYTPPDSVSADGSPGTEMHNRYPVLYHRSGRRFADAQSRPLVRFVRSGFTGLAPHAPVVWGGDPTTGYGFDGLRSSVTQALSMGLSGISSWGSDVGGFFTLSPDRRLTPELLARWIELGAVSGVMRTKAEGIGVPKAQRPQIWERPTLPVWRRYAKLRTQLYPYLVAASREYRRTGLPIMRHLALLAPGDPRAVRTEDVFGFGPDLLAAPVLDRGARSRRAYLPPGEWVELWRAARYDPRSGGVGLGGGRARVERGGRRRTVRAPLAELPLFARAGALLALLPPDVDTLSSYGDRVRGLTSLRDRRDELELLAFPRGASRARFDADGRLTSTERGRTWTLRVRALRDRRIALQASLATLERPFRPRVLFLDGRRLPRSRWSYDARDRVLRVAFAARRTTLRVR